MILPPQSKIGVIDDMTRNRIINNSPICGKYDEDLDDESAYEKISKKNEEKAEEEAKIKAEKEQAKADKEAAKKLAEEEKAKRKAEREKKNNPMYKLGKKAVNMGTTRIISKIFSALFKTKR